MNIEKLDLLCYNGYQVSGYFYSKIGTIVPSAFQLPITFPEKGTKTVPKCSKMQKMRDGESRRGIESKWLEIISVVWNTRSRKTVKTLEKARKSELFGDFAFHGNTPVLR